MSLQWPMPQVSPVLLSADPVVMTSLVVEVLVVLVASLVEAVTLVVEVTPVVGSGMVVVGTPVELLCATGAAPQNPSLHDSSVPQSLSVLQG